MSYTLVPVFDLFLVWKRLLSISPDCARRTKWEHHAADQQKILHNG